MALREQSATPGAIEVYRRRELPDGSLVEFEFAPAGTLTQDGKPRREDWRAYHFTPAPIGCLRCEGSGRVVGKRPAGKKCPNCDGEGWVGKRVRLPSVTTLLDSVCPKPGIPFWAEARGIEGAIEAVRLGLIDPEDPASAASAVAQVRAARLGADRARDTAAERGLNVHACLEHYMLTGEPPNPADHPAEHHGYLRAMTRWLLKTGIEPEAVEELVVHPDEGFAGRLDLRGRIDGVLHTCDIKTNERGSIWSGAHAQTACYEHAAVWCGDPPAEHRLVVVFAADGAFREQYADHSPSFTQAALAWAREVRPVDAMCEAANRVEREARKVAA